MNTLRVLLVDDDDDDTELTSAVLREVYQSECVIRPVASAEVARQAIADGQFDVCLVDYRMGSVNGVELIREAVSQGHDGPFILLTGLDEHEVDVEAMTAGASDYLVKGQLSPAVLERSIRYAIGAKVAQAAVRESERRLREIADNVGEVFFVWDYRAGALAYLSPAFERIFGRPASEAFADPARALSWVHAADRELVQHALAELAAGGTVEVDARILTPEGKECWVRGRGLHVANPQGDILRLEGTVQDVTQRRRAEHTQQILAAIGRVSSTTLDVQAALDAVAETLVPDFADSCGIDIVTADGDLERRAQKFVDPAKAAAIATLRRRYPLKHRPNHPIWSVFKSGRSCHIDEFTPAMVTEFASDPDERTLAHTARPESCIFAPLDTGSRILGVLLLCTDKGRARFDAQHVALAEEIGRRIAASVERARLYNDAQTARSSARAQADRARGLAEASRRFTEAEFETSLMKTVVETMSSHGDAAVLRLLSADGSQLSLVALHHRTPRGEARYRDRLRQVCPVHSPTIAGVLASGRSVVANYPLGSDCQSDPHEVRDDADDASLSAAFVLSPLRVRGRIIGTVTVFRDDAPFSSGDAAYLEEMAERAALTIDNARLFAESRLATQLRDDVIAVVAHDVANPLNNILLSARMLLGGSAADVTHRIEIIKRSAEGATRIMRDLLDTAAMASGRLTIEPAVVDAAQLVTEACDALDPSAQAASVCLQAEAPAGLLLRADHGRIIQVLSNLVGNSIKFTPEGGHITVRAEGYGREVRFSVADTGVGIAEEEADRVFAPYFQLKRGDQRGVGLGLSICKAIVEAHEGRIWVESADGQGTVFYFTVPSASDTRAVSEESAP